MKGCHDLDRYLERPGPLGVSRRSATIIGLESQEWRGTVWRHEIHVRFPPGGSAALGGPVFLYAGGRADVAARTALLDRIASAVGGPAAIVTDVPNQPLMGREESDLLAYTLCKHGAGEDYDWPLVFPMARSLVAAMDALGTELGAKTFLLSGSSKRAWAAWLAASRDPRVVGLAPISFELVDIRAQLCGARDAYGGDSECLSPFTALGLTHETLLRERASLVEAVDPLSFAEHLTMPKLIVTGANDPFWILDSHRHYVGSLPGSNSVLLIPGAGHDAAADPAVHEAIASWCRAVSLRAAIPEPRMRVQLEDGKALVELESDPAPEEARVFWAWSPNRDFRASAWRMEPMTKGRSVIDRPVSGHTGLFVGCRYSECSLVLGAPAAVL